MRNILILEVIVSELVFNWVQHEFDRIKCWIIIIIIILY